MNEIGFSKRQLWMYGFNLCRKVYDKYHGKCAICKNNNQLAIHHIDGKGRNFTNKGLKPNNKLSNLELLCFSCHQKKHLKQRWSKIIEEQGGYKYYGNEKTYHKLPERKAKVRDYYQKNKEVIKNHSHNYYLTHKEELKEKRKLYRQKLRERSKGEHYVQ